MVLPFNWSAEGHVSATNDMQPSTKEQALLQQSMAAQPKKACEDTLDGYVAFLLGFLLSKLLQSLGVNLLFSLS